MTEKDKIRRICEEIEKEQKITILFCVENGSRAWNMHSKDSDYDIRFVYKRNVESYLALNKSPEVITKSYNKELEPCEAKGCEYDVVGFDVYKFSRMLQSSNPTTIEWLMSPILYYGAIPERLYVVTDSRTVALPHVLWWLGKGLVAEKFRY